MSLVQLVAAKNEVLALTEKLLAKEAALLESQHKVSG